MDAGGEGLGALVRDVVALRVLARCFGEGNGRERVGNVRGDGGLVGDHVDGVGGKICAGGELLQGGGGFFAGCELETLDGGDLGVLDAVELVALCGVDGDGDGLAGGDLLEVVRSEAALLVVDEDTLERQSLAICLIVRKTVQTPRWASCTYWHQLPTSPWWHGH